MKKSLLRLSNFKNFDLKKINPFWLGLLATLITWGGYFLIIWPKMLYHTKDGVSAGWIGIYGDWAAHFSYAMPFAYRPASLWLLGHPLFHDRKFTYPFAADAISGLLIRFHIDPVTAFVVPSIITSLLLLYALYRYYWQFSKSPLQSFTALTLFLAGGGLGFYQFFTNFLKNPNLADLSFPPLEYTHLSKIGIEWINVTVGQFITQRSMLLGFPLTLALLLIIQYWYDTKFKSAKLWQLVGLGAVSSLMLIIHIHSYIVFALICLIFLAIDHKHWQKWLVFGVSAAIPSLLIYHAMYGGQLGQNFFQWYPGWLAQSGSVQPNWLYFWLLNWGLFLPFSIVAIWQTRRYKEPIIIGGLLIFVIANLMLFQPFPWDNTKLFAWVYLILASPAAEYLAILWRKHKLAMLAVPLLTLTMIAAGSLDLWRLTNTDKLSNQLWSNDDFTIAEQFREISQPSDIVLTSDQHNHWVPTLSGRPIVMGFRGWLWTYGIDYGGTERDVHAMYAGNDQTEQLLKNYKIKFVVIGNGETNSFTPNEPYFASHHRLVLQNNSYRVYQILSSN